MSDALAFLVIAPALLGALAMPVIASVRTMRNGASRARRFFLHTALSALPLLWFVAGFALLMGLEELTGAALVPEGLGRAALVVVAVALLSLLASTALGAALARR